MTYTLTTHGWPRPRRRGMPIPWVAPMENLAHVNEGRQLATVSGALCPVCGVGYAYGDDAYGFTCLSDPNGETRTTELPIEYGDALVDIPGMDPITDWVGFLDGSLMHWRCARLASVRCPHVRDRTDLICVRVPANDAAVREVDGKLRPTHSVEDAILVPWPATLPSPDPRDE